MSATKTSKSWFMIINPSLDVSLVPTMLAEATAYNGFGDMFTFFGCACFHKYPEMH